MKSKVPVILVFSLILPILSGCYSVVAKGEKNMLNESLQLVIKSDKNTYHIGDKIIISFIFKNNTKDPIYFINSNDGYTLNWITIFDENNKKLKGIRQVIYELPRYLERDAYILIKAGESTVIDINGEIKRGTFYEDGRIPIKGVAIDFLNSAVLIKGPGSYLIEGKYLPSASRAIEGKERYGLDNIWVSELHSNRIKIEIAE